MEAVAAASGRRIVVARSSAVRTPPLVRWNRRQPAEFQKQNSALHGYAQLAEIPSLNAAPDDADDHEEPAMEGEIGPEDESPEPLTVAAASDDPAGGESRDFDAGRSDADITQHVAVMQLRRELEAEIASVTQQYWLYQRQYVDVTPTMRAECLVPTIEQRWLMRQLYMIDRGIDRKVRLLMDQQWLGRREAVEILPKDDPGVTENSEKENV